MKSINAAATPSSYSSYDLDGRARSRGYSQFHTASALKREERRKQRRHLSAQLSTTLAHELAEGCFPILMPVEAANVPLKLEFIPAKILRRITVPAGYGVAKPCMKQVSIIRKSPMRRKTVETLQIPVRTAMF